MNIKQIILSSIVVFGLQSCNREDSSTVDQDKIYTSYALEYNATNDITYARANFNFSNAVGTKLELVDPAQVNCDGDILPFKQALAYYEKDYVGLKNSGVFEYVDLDNNTFTNTINMVTSIDLGNLPDTLSRSASYELIWDGDAISENGEIVTVTINGSGEGDAQIFTQTGINANSVILSASQLENLGLENATFHIRRVKNVPANQTTSAGGVVIARYIGTTKTVYISQ